MYKVVYKHGTFINYKGSATEFILAAVSIPADYVLVPVGDDFELDYGEAVDSPKILSLGLAVCREGDTWDEELGKKIAYNKAIKRRDHVLATTDSGIINTKVVEAIAEQEAAYMQVNPGRYIAGYDESKKKYFLEKSRVEYLNSLTQKEKLAIEVMASVKEPDKFLEAVEHKRKELANPYSGNIASVAVDKIVHSAECS